MWLRVFYIPYQVGKLTSGNFIFKAAVLILSKLLTKAF